MRRAMAEMRSLALLMMAAMAEARATVAAMAVVRTAELAAIAMRAMAVAAAEARATVGKIACGEGNDIELQYSKMKRLHGRRGKTQCAMSRMTRRESRLGRRRR